MKNAFPRSLTLLILVSIIALSFKCEKDEEVVPIPSSGDIEILISDSIYLDRKFLLSDTLTNVVNIDVAILKRNEVVKSQFYIDGKLVTEDNEAPFGFSWNSLRQNDGRHNLKVVLSDKKGNSSEVSNEILVHNALIKIKTAEVLRDAYIILSDRTGNRIFSEKLTNNIQKDIKSTVPVYDNQFAVTTVRVDENAVSVNTIINPKKGSSFSVSDSPQQEQRKNLTLTVTGDKNIATGFLETNTDIRTINEPQFSSNLNLTYRDGSSLYVEVVRAGKVFYDLIKITGGDMNIDLANINKAASVVTVPTISGASSNLFKVGYLNNTNNGLMDGYFLSYNYKAPTEGLVTTEYPSPGFDYYFTSIYATSGNKIFARETLGEIPLQFSVIQADANLQNKNLGSFSAMFTGDFDRYRLSYSGKVGGENYYWNLSALSSQTKFSMPEIANVIGKTGFTHDALTLDYILMVKQTGFTNNGDYFYTTPFTPPYESLSVNISFKGSGQRKLSGDYFKRRFERAKQAGGEGMLFEF